MSMIFRAMGVYRIVVDGIHPPPDADIAEHDGYQALSRHALLTIVQVNKVILKKVSKYESPHEV